VPRVHRGRIPEDGFVFVVATNPHERELSAVSQSSSLDHLVVSGASNFRRREAGRVVCTENLSSGVVVVKSAKDGV